MCAQQVSCPCIVGKEYGNREQLVVAHMLRHANHSAGGQRGHTKNTAFHPRNGVVHTTEHPDFPVRFPAAGTKCTKSRNLKDGQTRRYGNRVLMPQVFHIPERNTYLLAVWKTGTQTITKWAATCGQQMRKPVVRLDASHFRGVLLHLKGGKMVSVYRDDPIARFISGFRTIFFRNHKRAPEAAMAAGDEGALETLLENTIVRDLACTNYNFKASNIRNLHIAPTATFHSPARFASSFREPRPKWGSDGLPDMEHFCFDELIPLSDLNDFLAGMTPDCAFEHANKGTHLGEWVPSVDVIRKMLYEKRPDLLRTLCDVYFMDFACYGIEIPAACR